MAIHSIKELQARRRTEVDVYDIIKVEDMNPGDLVYSYLPSAVVTKPQLRRITEAGKSEDWEVRYDSSTDFLYSAMYDWNMTYGEGDEDEEGKSLAGKPLPLTKENIEMLGADIHAHMIEAMFAKMNSGEPSGANSTDTSSQDVEKLQP